ncbi:phosphotransferase enzyme family protein [Hirsutella rhossiliensis]|uniref:Phosphotransferase enzyme family domain-containing protein n=1 Tax=Hirsutella rhossiliensis TaxID=111463 RepID=A0A9P8MQ33_9HYPO|nr:phosphotransferase enzyme family domain-containing protein [Hirsutella rhossiliensis]KAH0958424.1 phosphotransferase enzyme family domain-containing protein [Hirsutella rhossiliensis]
MDSKKHESSIFKSRGNRVLKRKPITLAAKWNTHLLRGLEAKLKEDPEANLEALLPVNYTTTLQSYKKVVQRPNTVFQEDDIRSHISLTPFEITFKLSANMNDLLRDSDLPRAITKLLDGGELIYQGAGAASAVFRVSQDIVVKITNEESASTDLGSLLFLQEHLPAFPAPRPHGLIRTGKFCLLFTTFVPGLDLERAWPRLDDTHKKSIGVQLDRLFTQLRSLSKPSDMPLGGVQGEGCKDARRGLRFNKEPIRDAEQFQDFIFSGSTSASPVYTQLLRSLALASPRCVMTHGDIRPANIMVEQREHGTWEVVSIIDWETSGFYPEDNDDWYAYLPDSLSPQQYANQCITLFYYT